MGQATIPVDYAVLASHYPRRLSKEGQFGGKLDHPELRKVMDRCPGTPCCVQISHSLNMAGFRIPRAYPGSRRPNEPQEINGVVYHYLLAVDEMETYLTDAYGPGELVRSDTDKQLRRTAAGVRASLKGRKGILVMREGPYGVHTELWDGAAFHQKDMAVDHLLTRPRVLFWECTLAPPSWLSSYMGY